MGEIQGNITRMLPPVIRSAISFANANISVRSSRKKSVYFSASAITERAKYGFNSRVTERDVQLALDEMVRTGVLETKRSLISAYLTKYYRLAPGQELFISVVRGVVHYSYGDDD